jgi:hypothetical protein
VIPAETEAAAWIASQCHHFNMLLSERARRKPPAGLMAYLSDPGTAEGKAWLRVADADVAALVAACGGQPVRHAYGGDLVTRWLRNVAVLGVGTILVVVLWLLSLALRLQLLRP